MQIACATDCGKIWITVHLAAYMEWCEKQESVIPAAFFPSPFVAITWNITDHYKWKSITFTHERTRKYTHINLHIISRKYYETKRPLSNFVGLIKVIVWSLAVVHEQQYVYYAGQQLKSSQGTSSAFQLKDDSRKASSKWQSSAVTAFSKRKGKKCIIWMKIIETRSRECVNKNKIAKIKCIKHINSKQKEVFS